AGRRARSRARRARELAAGAEGSPGPGGWHPERARQARSIGDAMADKHRIQVEILGQKYAIRSEGAPEYVPEPAGDGGPRVRQIRGDGGSGQDPVKLLALAALYITDELFRQRDERALADNDTGTRLGVLSQLLDAAAPPAHSS